MIVTAHTTRFQAGEQVAEYVPVVLGRHRPGAVRFPDMPKAIVVVVGGAVGPDAPGLEAIAVVGVGDSGAGGRSRYHPVEDIPGEGAAGRDAGQVAVGVVGVGCAAGLGEPVVGIVGVVRCPAGRGLGEAVSHGVHRPGVGAVAAGIGRLGQPIQRIVRKGRRPAGIGLGESVAVRVVGVGEALEGGAVRGAVGDGREPVVVEEGVGDGRAIRVAQAGAVARGIVAEGPGDEPWVIWVRRLAAS